MSEIRPRRSILYMPASNARAIEKARAGQTLSWRLEGPTSRVLLTYPDGQVDGPGLPAAIVLPANGVYVFEVRPNLMADDAHGRFRLTFTIR